VRERESEREEEKERDVHLNSCGTCGSKNVLECLLYINAVGTQLQNVFFNRYGSFNLNPNIRLSCILIIQNLIL